MRRKWMIEDEDYPGGDIDFKGFDEQFQKLLVFGTIECHATCGIGGFGEVFKSHLKGREVAVKHVKIERQQHLDNIENEISLMLKYKHEFIIELHHVHRTEKDVCILMELAACSLRQYLEEKKGPLPSIEIVTFGLQIAKALQYCISLNSSEAVHHCDLKIENILIVEDKTMVKIAKLADFGVAHTRRRSGNSVRTPATKSGHGFDGTICWQGPEIHHLACKSNTDSSTNDNIGHRGEESDVYAFGLILWSMATGNYPLIDKDPDIILSLLLNGERPEIPIDAHPTLVHVIRSCWRQNYKQRPRFQKIINVLSMCEGGNFHLISKENLDQLVPICYSRIEDMFYGELYQYLTENGVPESSAKKLRDEQMNGKLFLRTTQDEFERDYRLPIVDTQYIISLQKLAPGNDSKKKLDALDSKSPPQASTSSSNVNEGTTVTTSSSVSIFSLSSMQSAIPSQNQSSQPFNRPKPLKAINEMNTDELVSYLRGQKGILDSFLNGLQQEEVTGEFFLKEIDEEILKEEPFNLRGIQLRSTLNAIKEIKLL